MNDWTKKSSDFVWISGIRRHWDTPLPSGKGIAWLGCAISRGPAMKRWFFVRFEAFVKLPNEYGTTIPKSFFSNALVSFLHLQNWSIYLDVPIHLFLHIKDTLVRNTNQNTTSTNTATKPWNIPQIPHKYAKIQIWNNVSSRVCSRGLLEFSYTTGSPKNPQFHPLWAWYPRLVTWPPRVWTCVKGSSFEDALGVTLPWKLTVRTWKRMVGDDEPLVLNIMILERMVVTRYPPWKRTTYPFPKHFWVDDFPFSKFGYVSSPEGSFCWGTAGGFLTHFCWGVGNNLEIQKCHPPRLWPADG